MHMSIAKLTRGLTLLIGLSLAACASAPSSVQKSVAPKPVPGMEKSVLELIDSAPQRTSLNSCAAAHMTLVCESSGFSGRHSMDRCSCMDPNQVRMMLSR
jgi:hypothetical protein